VLSFCHSCGQNVEHEFFVDEASDGQEIDGWTNGMDIEAGQPPAGRVVFLLRHSVADQPLIFGRAGL
jgi:hypothetical protein